jgi:glycosyltransferase involved in cell wall biosynthesis
MAGIGRALGAFDGNSRFGVLEKRSAFTGAVHWRGIARARAFCKQFARQSRRIESMIVDRIMRYRSDERFREGELAHGLSLEGARSEFVKPSPGWRMLAYWRRRMFPKVTRKPRRIVVCALGTYSKIGGLQNFNRRLIQNLAARALERGEPSPLVFVFGDEGAPIPTIEGIDIIAPKGRWRFSWNAVWASVTQANVFMICHVNLLPLATFVGFLRPKTPIMLFVHGYEAWNNPRYRAKRWYESWLLRALTRIASVSAFTADTMAREFNVSRAKFRLLPNAVDPLPTAFSASRPGPTTTILTVTRLDPSEREKNVDQMLQAVAELKATLPTIRYEIVGDGALRPELEMLANDLGVGDIVKFLGRVDDLELNAAYDRATVFAMLSSKEGFGIVYLEAWQRGLPVICGSKGASKEIVADGLDGFVVDAADISMISDRLSLLLSRPEMAKAIGEAGRRKVEAKYLNFAFRSNLDGIIDELLEEAARGRTGAGDAILR